MPTITNTDGNIGILSYIDSNVDYNKTVFRVLCVLHITRPNILELDMLRDFFL